MSALGAGSDQPEDCLGSSCRNCPSRTALAGLEWMLAAHVNMPGQHCADLCATSHRDGCRPPAKDLEALSLLLMQKLASVPAQGHVLMCDHVFGIAQALQAMLRYSKTATRNLQTSA